MTSGLFSVQKKPTVRFWDSMIRKVSCLILAWEEKDFDCAITVEKNYFSCNCFINKKPIWTHVGMVHCREKNANNLKKTCICWLLIQIKQTMREVRQNEKYEGRGWSNENEKNKV